MYACDAAAAAGAAGSCSCCWSCSCCAMIAAPRPGPPAQPSPVLLCWSRDRGRLGGGMMLECLDSHAQPNPRGHRNAPLLAEQRTLVGTCPAGDFAPATRGGMIDPGARAHMHTAHPVPIIPFPTGGDKICCVGGCSSSSSSCSGGGSSHGPPCTRSRPCSCRGSSSSSSTRSWRRGRRRPRRGPSRTDPLWWQPGQPPLLPCCSLLPPRLPATPLPLLPLLLRRRRRPPTVAAARCCR